MNNAEIVYAGETKQGDVPISFNGIKASINYKLASKIRMKRTFEFNPEFRSWFIEFHAKNSDCLGFLLNTGVKEHEELHREIILKIIENSMGM